MYITRFIRVDHRPNEDYYYNTQEEAEKHMRLFEDDNSGLYYEIQVVDAETGDIVSEPLKDRKP